MRIPSLLLGLAALSAIVLSTASALTENLPGDQTISLWLQGLGTGWLEDVMNGVTSLGGTTLAISLLVLAAVVLVVRSHRVDAFALPVVALGTVLMPITKELVHRPRPSSEIVAVLSSVGGHSFPSGHAFLATVVFGALFHMAGRICGPHTLLVLTIRALLVLAILAVGASRVYLGAHWPSDVLGGYLLGGLSLFATIWLFESFARPILSVRLQPSPLPK